MFRNLMKTSNSMSDHVIARFAVSAILNAERGRAHTEREHRERDVRRELVETVKTSEKALM